MQSDVEKEDREEKASQSDMVKQTKKKRIITKKLLTLISKQENKNRKDQNPKLFVV
jgi:hypothetical protein